MANHDAYDWNRCQFTSRPYSQIRKGHYESYFLRANHPSKAAAFWIRYTIFAPKNKIDQATGELWAIYFDGESNQVTALKDEFPIRECSFSATSLDVKIGEAALSPGHLAGHIANKKHQLSWQLNYQFNGQSDHPNAPLFFLKKSLYRSPLPKAKSVVGAPNVLFNGTLTVNDQIIDINQWQGSENHNWGSQHTDEYAWGQVAGFDDRPEAFLECISARIKIGPLWSPQLGLAVLRIGEKEYRFNGIKKAFQAKGRYDFGHWSLKTSNGQENLELQIQAPSHHFVGLTYNNPPGGTHTCLNTKIAQCTATLTDKHGQITELKTQHRAAFEILTDRTDHKVDLLTS